MTVWIVGGILFLLWVGFNWVAPLAVLVEAKPISPGRLPSELLVSNEARKVKFYLADLNLGYGYSVWSPPWSMILFDRRFFNRASPALVRFVIAHELAHFSLNHHRKRWFLVVLGLAILPSVRNRFRWYEFEADAEATRRTGLTRAMFLELPQGDPHGK